MIQHWGVTAEMQVHCCQTFQFFKETIRNLDFLCEFYQFFNIETIFSPNNSYSVAQNQTSGHSWSEQNWSDHCSLHSNSLLSVHPLTPPEAPSLSSLTSSMTPSRSPAWTQSLYSIQHLHVSLTLLVFLHTNSTLWESITHGDRL